MMCVLNGVKMSINNILKRLLCNHYFKLNRIVSFNGQRIVIKNRYNIKLVYNTYTCKFICKDCNKERYVSVKKLIRVEEMKYATIMNVYIDNFRAHIDKKLPKGIIRDCKFRK
jgi:hypothetical protein